MNPIYRSYLIEIPTGTSAPGAGSQLFIRDYPTLRNVWFCGIAFVDDNILVTAPSGLAVSAQLGSVLFTAVDKFNMEVVRQAPTKDLSPFYNYGYYRDFVPFQIQLTKSFITTTGTLTANQSICANLFYMTNEEYTKANALRTR